VADAPPLHTCVQNGQIVCWDDLCRGGSRTLCGLEEGIDFGVDDDEDDGEWWADVDEIGVDDE
jgi:hypothetical protein